MTATLTRAASTAILLPDGDQVWALLGVSTWRLPVPLRHRSGPAIAQAVQLDSVRRATYEVSSQVTVEALLTS